MSQVSNNIIECIKNGDVDCLNNGVIDNLFWLIPTLIIGSFGTYLVRFCINFIKAIKIKKKLLYKNRVGSTGRSTYLADRLKEIWQSDLNYPQKYGGNNTFQNAIHTCDIMDKNLVDYHLIRVDSENFGYKAVIPIKNQRNKIVFWFVRRYFFRFLNEIL